MIHSEKSEFAGKKVRIKKSSDNAQIENFGGAEILIEDYWDRVYGMSWKISKGVAVCMVYAVRTGFSDVYIPVDDEVLYGKIGGLGCLTHISEIEELVTDSD